MIGATLFLNVISFYPLYSAQKYGDRMTTTLIAIAMCAFEFAGVVFTPVHAMSMSKMGRKNALIIGEVINVITNTIMGLLSLLSADKPMLFFWISALTRFA